MRVFFWFVGCFLMLIAYFSFGLANTAWQDRKGISPSGVADRRVYSWKTAGWIVFGFLCLALMWFVLGL